MRSPAAERRRPTLLDGAAALLVAAAAVALLFFLQPEESNFLTASVVLEGETIAEYELSTLTGPVTLVVDKAPYPLTIQAEPGRIRIAESACPSQDCVHTGWISRAGQQIICLPDRLTRCAVLTALALALSVAEGLVPLTILFPLPGLRLGLANLVTVYALCRLSGREALLILAARCLLGALLGGNLMALAFSLTGGLLAFGVMALLLRCSFLSLFGVSIAGAAAHNTGQILAAMAVLGSRAPLVYLPPLLLCSLVTGAVTGGASMLLVHRIPLPGDIKS